MTPKFVFSLSWCRVVDGVKGAARRVGVCVVTVLGLVGGAPAQGWGGDTARRRLIADGRVPLLWRRSLRVFLTVLGLVGGAHVL